LSGKDKETRPSVAFNMLKVKLETSESKKHWNYIIKSLIIFDRIIEEKLYLDEIAKIKIQDIEEYRTDDNKLSNIEVSHFENFRGEKYRSTDKKLL